MKRSDLLFLLVAACLTLSGCVQSAATAGKIDLKVITGHYHAGHRIMTRIANEKGWFGEEGLGRVEISPLGTSGDRLMHADVSQRALAQLDKRFGPKGY